LNGSWHIAAFSPEKLPAYVSRHGFLAQISTPFLFLHIDGRPHFAKLSIGVIEQVKIAAIDPD
jgi:hypothetical protein